MLVERSESIRSQCISVAFIVAIGSLFYDAFNSAALLRQKASEGQKISEGLHALAELSPAVAFVFRHPNPVVWSVWNSFPSKWA